VKQGIWLSDLTQCRPTDAISRDGLHGMGRYLLELMRSAKLLLSIPVILALWLSGAEMIWTNANKDVPSRQRSLDMVDKVRFFVDPKTNSDNPDIRMAYGLNVVPPWADGGSLFINFPEHLEYMPGTRGIARHHDKRENVWQVSSDGSEAWYEVESITEPGVFFSVKAHAENGRALFKMTITNRSQTTLGSIRPLICYQYHGLKGFPASGTDNFAHTFIAIAGRPVALENLTVRHSEAYARMAQVKGCPDEHNWWAQKMGGFIEEPMDMAFTALTASTDDRKVVVFWTPGKNLLSNSAIPCIHADPYFGDLKPGESRSARGELIFARTSLEKLVEELAEKAEQPW
jgi:hypothetical protein